METTLSTLDTRANIAGLKPNTQYTFHVIAANSGFRGPISNIVTMTTPQEGTQVISSV